MHHKRTTLFKKSGKGEDKKKKKKNRREKEEDKKRKEKEKENCIEFLSLIDLQKCQRGQFVEYSQ